MTSNPMRNASHDSDPVAELAALANQALGMPAAAARRYALDILHAVGEYAYGSEVDLQIPAPPDRHQPEIERVKENIRVRAWRERERANAERAGQTALWQPRLAAAGRSGLLILNSASEMGVSVTDGPRLSPDGALKMTVNFDGWQLPPDKEVYLDVILAPWREHIITVPLTEERRNALRRNGLDLEAKLEHWRPAPTNDQLRQPQPLDLPLHWFTFTIGWREEGEAQ